MRSSTAARPHLRTRAGDRLERLGRRVARAVTAPTSRGAMGALGAALAVGAVLGLSACTGGPSQPGAGGNASSSAAASAAASPSGTGQSDQPASVLPTDLGTIATAPAGAPPDEDIPLDSGPLPTWDDTSRAAVVQAASTTMAAFAQPGVDHDTWWAGLREHITPESAPDLVLVDPANIPASRVTGDGRITADTSAAVASVVVPTDSGDWTLVMVRASGADPWLADRITPPAGQH